MSNFSPKNGSIKVFAIVAIVLVLIALGVIYTVGRASTNDAASVKTSPGELVSDSETTDDSKQDKSSEDKDADPFTGQTQPDEDEGSEDSPKGDNLTSGSNSVAETETNNDRQESNPNDTSDASDLPQTGPRETMTAFALALVVTTVTAYIRSKRSL